MLSEQEQALEEFVEAFVADRIQEDRVKMKKMAASVEATVPLFTEDAQFNDLLTRHEATKRDAYLTLAAERAARLAAIPIHEAREMVEEIVKKTAKLFEGAGQ